MEAVKKLREIDPEVKAIISGGYFNDPVMIDFRMYGFCGAMPKPYRKAELENALKQILKNPDGPVSGSGETTTK